MMLSLWSDSAFSVIKKQTREAKNIMQATIKIIRPREEERAVPERMYYI
jgi:hypothetical protein